MRLPVKVMLAASAVSVSVTVAASTVLEKVVPPDWVRVTVPISVPTAPLIVAAPVVWMVRLEVEPLSVPVTDERLKVLAIPVPTVKVTPSAKVAAPKVMLPVEVPPTVELPPTLIPVSLSPKVMTPVPAAVTIPLRLILLGAVAVTPPVKAMVSLPFPKVSVPVLEKVTALVIVFDAPLNTTL